MDVPTSQEISDDIVAQLEASLAQTIPLLPKAFLRVLAKVLAGVFILLWKYAGFIFLQLFVSEATFFETTVNGKVIRPLLKWGQLAGVSDPAPAVQAQHIVAINVTTQTGTLAAGAQLIDETTNVVHETLLAVALDAPQVAVEIRAVSDQNGGDGSGTIGNLETGATLSFATSYPNVASEALVTSRTVDGSDAESTDSYRARVIEHFQARPQGGAYADYREWGEAVDGIARIYPYAADNPGEVDIYVEVDADVDPDGIPDAGHLSAVFDAIQLDDMTGKATRRPIGAAVNTLAIARKGFDVKITNLDVPDPASTKDEIKQGLDEYFRSREPFIEGLSILPRADRITDAAIGGIVDSIVSAAGGTVSAVDLIVSGSPLPSYTLAHGEKAKLAGDPIYV